MSSTEKGLTIYTRLVVSKEKKIRCLL